MKFIFYSEPLYHKNPMQYRPTARYSTQLHDITNSRDMKLVQKGQKRRKLLNENDVATIAHRQRQQFQTARDTNELQTNIEKLDTQIEKLRKRLIPEIQYNIGKRQSMINRSLSKSENYHDTIQKIDVTINQTKIDLNIELEQMVKTLQTKIDDTVTSHNYNMIKFNETKSIELEELNKIPPKKELLKEIEILERDLKTLNNEIKNLEMSNEMFATELDEKLDSEFQLLREQKITKLETSKKETEQKQWNLDEIKFKVQDSQLNITEMTQEIERLTEENNILQQDINSIEKSSILPEQQLKQLVKNLEELNQEHNVLLEMENLENENLEIHYDIFNKDIEKRKKLQNTIDELNGHIRTFALIGEKENGILNDPNYKVNDNLIYNIAKDTSKPFTFNRLFQNENDNMGIILQSDIKIYCDMCLNNKEDFNIFNISSDSTPDSQVNILKFFSTNYQEKYDISFQNLSLYNEKFDDDSPFSVKNNSITLDRTPVQLKDDIPTNLEEISDKELIQLKILKIMLCGKNDKDNQIDFYFLQIDNIDTMKLLQRFLTKQDPWNKTQIGLFILKILNYTKSCFISDLSQYLQAEATELMLQISKNISKIRNPVRKIKD